MHRPRGLSFRQPQPDSALTYLGTYAADRSAAFDRLLIAAAREAPHERFVVGGPQYPDWQTWPRNVTYQAHVPQSDHLAFYGRGRFTLNLTRGAMLRWGHCPSARLFEAAACGTPLLTDDWPGLDEFFTPDEDVIVVREPPDVLAALRLTPERVAGMRERARAQVLRTCTADHRVGDLERALERSRAPAA